MVDEREDNRQAERPLRVLVVDDNRDAADSLGLLLKLWGYDYRVAYDGAAGLEMARAYRPDCLVLDLGMPRLDGYGLAVQLRREPGLERTKLLALTAYSDEERVRRAREVGFDFHLVKPAHPTEVERILNMLNEAIRLASKTEELARQNVALTSETKELLQEVKQDIQEVKEQVREVKEEVKDLKEDLREMKETQADERPEAS